MARGTVEHMLAVAKKKPALGAIVDNLDNYTIEQLDNVAGQPAWIRKHLITHKKATEKRAAGYLTPEEIAHRMTNSTK